MAYTPQTWHDSPATDTPIDAAHLAHIESGIQATAVVADAALPAAQKAAANGVASLDGTSKIPTGQIPSLSGIYDVAGAATAAQSASLQKSSNLSDLVSAATARTSLGLGSSATHPATDFATAGPHQFRVEDYGAVGDGTTDDTTAIRNAVNAAVTWAQSNGNYAEVVFKSATYLVNGSPIQGGTTHGNAIIPLPVVDTTTAKKVTLKLRGAGPVDALAHWSQTASQRTGTVLKTTRTDGTNHVTYGPASVVGGPTLVQGWGTGFATPWNNLRPVVDGVMIQTPTNPTYCGFDFQACAEATVLNGAAFTDAPPSGQNQAAITNQWTWGLAMPVVNNNALSDIIEWSCQGFTTGVFLSEHTVAYSVRCMYCIVGINWVSGGGVSSPHGGVLLYGMAEQCGVGMSVFNDGSIKLRVVHLDTEANGHCINDPNNLGKGEVYATGDGVDVVGGAGLRVIDGDVAPGVSAATVPSTQNTNSTLVYRDRMIIPAGGTVTGYKVNGTSIGTPSSFVVPTGKAWQWAGSAAPTATEIRL